MTYLMLDVTDKYDYDIHEELVCSKLKALQQQMENYLLADGLYPRFTISEGAFRDGTLCEISTDTIVTNYEKWNGIVVPVMDIIRHDSWRHDDLCDDNDWIFRIQEE